MFESLSERLGGILDRLTKRGALSENDVNEAMREVRRALIEADVALDVVRSFTDKVKAHAVGQEVVRSVTPGQMVVKIVHDQLVEMLGSDAQSIDLNAPAPVALMLVGLQGSGKTTTAAKIARRLTDRSKAKVLLAPSIPVARRHRSSSACWASRPTSTRCRSFPASSRSRSRAAPRPPRASAATTSSSSTPPAAPTSTSR
jgi:signal recognition particle GTPase